MFDMSMETFFMKLSSQKIEIDLHPKNLMEGLLLDECQNIAHISDSAFKWHYLLTKTFGPLQDNENVLMMRNWGISFDPASFSNVEHILKSKRKRYKKVTRAIEEIRQSSEYDQALSHVRSLFGHTLKDGTQFYEYQLQDAALAMFKPRILLAYEMGLGKTRTSLAATLANPKNKKILIVTMSRNLNDWMREIKNIGFEDDYIVLKHPRDLRSSKRIHLVSYENWANEKRKTVFKLIEAQECPVCKTSYRNPFFRKARFCTFCRHKAAPTQERYSEKRLPEFCLKCNAEWKKGAITCTNSYWDKGKVKSSCNYSILEESHHSLSDFYKNYMYDASIVDEVHYISASRSTISS